MADVVLNQEGGTALFSGNKKVITHYNNVSDSSGATTKILDISDYSNVAGSLPVSATLNKIWYSVSVTAKVDALRMSWDNSGTDPIFLTLEGDGHFDYSSIGGIKNNEATNFTGDVVIVMPACTANDSATITCEWLKNY